MKDKTYEVFYFEDNRAEAERMQERLGRPKVEEDDPELKVTYSADYASALKKLKEWSGAPPHAALLDKHQNDYSGAGLVLSERILERWPTVPIVIISNDLEHTLESRILRAGMIFLSKDILENKDHGELIRNMLIGQIERTDTIRTYEADDYTTGSLEVKMNIPLVSWRGKRLNLDPSRVRIVHGLAKEKSRGKLCQYRDMLHWGCSSQDVVRQRIKDVRHAFQEVDDDFLKACEEKRHGIVNVHGKGYCWISDGDDAAQ